MHKCPVYLIISPDLPLPDRPIAPNYFQIFLIIHNFGLTFKTYLFIMLFIYW